VSGVTVAGRIEAGTIQIGEDVIAIPGGEHGLVKSKNLLFIRYCSLVFSNFYFFFIKDLEINDEISKWAVAGDSILMTLTGLDIIQLK
jgi:elongation factor 1 alpha-like protein